MKINYLKKISNKNHHDAFTDLNQVNNVLYLCFRRASDHHSYDGSIVIQRLTLTGKLLEQCELSLANSDLRDPKLHILSDNSLLLSAYARKMTWKNKQQGKEQDKEGSEKLLSQNTYWHSVDGLHWQHRGFYCRPFHWCWRLTWLNEKVYGLAYERETENLYLYHGASLSEMSAFPEPVLSKTKHGLGYPNESDLCFIDTPFGTQALAIVRRDADTYTTQLGKSFAPFSDWEWQDLSIYLASPCIKKVNKNNLIVAARYEHGKASKLNEAQKSMINYYASGDEKVDYAEGELKTGLFNLDISSGKLRLLLPLPSADDNGYPGIVIIGQKLWVSYYSTPFRSSGESADVHVKSTQVYLCEISND